MLDIDKLRKLGKIKRFKRDEYVFHEGDTGDEMYIVLSGKVNVYINSIDGFPIHICELGASDFFGEMSLLENQSRSASIVAFEDTTLLSIDNKNFHTFISENPSLSIKLMKGLSSRIRKMDNEMKRLFSQPSVSNRVKREREITEDIKKNRPESNLSPSILYPSGHTEYQCPILNEADSNNFLFSKKIECPVCGDSFDAQYLRMSKLKAWRVDFDSRARYVDFEPLWLMIISCPFCFYANFHSEFHLILPGDSKVIYTKSLDLREETNLNSPEINGINKAFTNYYLALYSAKAVPRVDNLKLAKLWLHLSWLYEDIKDTEMVSFAATQAINYYHEEFFGEKANIMLQYEAHLNLILGELYLKKKDIKNAIKYFKYTINSRGDETYKLQARNRIKYLSAL